MTQGQGRHVAITADTGYRPTPFEYAQAFGRRDTEAVLLDRPQYKNADRVELIGSSLGLVALTLPEPTDMPVHRRLMRNVRRAIDAGKPIVFPNGFPSAVPEGLEGMPQVWQQMGGIEVPEDVRHMPLDIVVRGIETALFVGSWDSGEPR
jgi:hypothetical protein